MASQEGERGEVDAERFGRFNRKENMTPYRKPPKLFEVLEELFDIELKLRSCEMWEAMKKMTDVNGDLLFCFSKWRVTGMLLTEDQIQAWINTRTQWKKKQAAGRPTEKDIEQERMIRETVEP